MLPTKQQIVCDIYSNEELVSMTKELTDSLRKNRTIDWQKKESARAGIRRMIKHFLKKYHYPPEEAANAWKLSSNSVSNGWIMSKRIILQEQSKSMKTMKLR